MKKRFIVILAALLAALLMASVVAEVPTIEKVEYEGYGKVDIDFWQDVQYSDPAIVVTDGNGQSVDVKVLERDDDDLDIRIAGVVPGMTYEFEISGIAVRGTGDYGSVTGSFTVPADAGDVSIAKVEYDRDDRELEIEFSCKVSYKDLKVEVYDADGNSVQAKVTEKDTDDLEVRIGKLTSGATYTVVVSGVGPRDGNSYGEVSAEFTAW